MSIPFTPPADRFAALIAGMCRAVGNCIKRGGPYSAPSGPLPGQLISVICVRLMRLNALVAALSAKARAGTLRAHIRPRPAPEPASPRATAPRKPPPALDGWMPTGPWGQLPRLPNGHAWLIRLAREAGCFSQLLVNLLAETEMVALAAASPGLNRRLRGLCRALGWDPPPEMPPLPPRRPAQPRTPAPRRGPPREAEPGACRRDPGHPPPTQPRRSASDSRTPVVVQPATGGRGIELAPRSGLYFRGPPRFKPA